MVGLGGGVFIIPALTLFLGVPIHSAISASLIAVVATSTTAAAAYVREDLSNMRLGMTMETMTVSGALVGGFVGRQSQQGSAVGGLRRRHDRGVGLHGGRATQAVQAPLAHDEDLGRARPLLLRPQPADVGQLRVHRLPVGMGVSGVAGAVSGLLGVGGGFLKVPVMVLAMGCRCGRRSPPAAS